VNTPVPITPRNCPAGPRFVGDPIDVVTGAATDTPIDLAQRGPIPFRWVRYYSSARRNIQGSLGWGHSHEFDLCLRRDLDGIRYEGPLGEVIGFPDLEMGESRAAGGKLLTRKNAYDFVIAQTGEPDQEFRFASGSDVGRLVRLRSGSDTIEFACGASGALKEIVDSRGRLIRVTYDVVGRVVGLTLPDPNDREKVQVLLTYEYDDEGNLIRAADLYHTSLSFAYDRAGLMIRRTDRNGYSFHFEYDDLGRCIHSRGDDGLFEVFLEYYPEAKMTFVRRGDGGQWIYHYNEAGVITQIIDPYGNATTFVIDDLGRPIQEIDPNGNVTQLHYNWLGQHDYRIDPNGYYLEAYAANASATGALPSRLPETPLEWEFGNLVRRDTIKPPTNDDPVLCLFPMSVRHTILDDSNVDQAASHSSGTPELQQADDYERPIERGGIGFTERWKYDANGNLIEHRDRDGGVSRWVFGSWNSLQKEINPLGHVIQYEHTVQGLVSKVIDPGGHVTEYGYNLRGELIEVRRLGRVRESYRRDNAGNIVCKTNTEGQALVNWEIGPGNLDMTRILSSGEKHEFEYDERGRITVAKAPSGTVTMDYDEEGRLLSDRRDGEGVVHEFGRRSLLSTTYFEKLRVRYGTDNSGDWLITDPLGGQHRFKCSSSGSVAKQFANGHRELCRYDTAGRCLHKAVVRMSSAATPWMRSYGYSLAGDLLSVIDTDDGQTKYAHDIAHRLAEEVTPGGGSRRFGYDTAGNLLFQPGLTDVAIEAGNRIRKANGDLFNYNDRDQISFRTSQRATTRYEYDDLDMLVRCDINGSEWTASYDPLGRRVRKVWQGCATTYYWDDFRLACELRPDGSVRIYIYVDEIALVPFLFLEFADLGAKPDSGSCYYLFTNQIGVPIRVEDANGKVCWKARIDPYGRAEVSKDSTIDMPLRFPGHYFDAETGLHYNRYRYFSPELGRYLQSDPAGQLGGINLFAYPVNPLTNVDITGLTTGPPRPSMRINLLPKAAAAPAAGAECGTAADPAVQDYGKEGEIVRRFDSKQGIKDAKKNGIPFDPEKGNGIPTTSTDIEPRDPDKIKKATGADAADHFADIDISGKKVLRTKTKEGQPEIRVQEDINPEDIVATGRTEKGRGKPGARQRAQEEGRRGRDDDDYD
jgi:RHS repeat-associated protein